MATGRTVAFDVGTRMLEGAVTNLAQGTVAGQLRGLHLTLRLTSRGAASSQTSWTEIDVLVATPGAPGQPGLSLELRPQTEAQLSYVQRGLAVDVVIGERRFDAAFIVEAAPTDVVRELLTRSICERLLAFHPLEVTTIDQGLRVAKEGWLEDVNALESLLEAAAELGDRAQAAIREADSASPLGASYRGAPGAALEAQRREELAALAQVKARRAEHELRQLLIVLGVVLLGSIVVLVLVALFGHGETGDE